MGAIQSTCPFLSVSSRMSAYAKLRFGLYQTSQFKYGEVVIDSVRGEVVTDRIPLIN